MTLLTEVELGEDIKELISKHPDFHNLTNVKKEEIQDNELYHITKHIGYYESEKKSGIFLLKIEEVNDEFIKKNF